MPRVARVVVPGVPHHVTQRGDNRQEVFFVDDDRGVYLELLAGQAQRFGLDVLGYCLMSNHVHLIAVPQREESLARAIGGFGCPSARATEVRMGRRIRPLPIGRPKKVVEDEENA